MIRNAIVTAVVGSMIATAAIVGPSYPGKLLAQATDAEQVDQPALEQLRRGQRASSPAWDVQVGNVFIADSPARLGWSEVRLEITVRNKLEVPIPYADTAFFDGSVFPRLRITDAEGVERPYSTTRPHRTAVGTSWVQEIPPGLTGTWTVGFQVPTRAAETLLLTASFQGFDFAVWDLLTGDTRQLWDPPAGMPTVALGETVAWAPDIEVTPVDHGSLVCGDPNLQYVTHIFAVRVDVANLDAEQDLPFPGSRYPATAAVAQWSNGATAEMTGETFFGDAETLTKRAADLVLIPPTKGDLHSRALMFGVPRDARLVSVDDAPVGVQLNRPDGTAVWLELEGEGTVAINPAFCNDGHFPFVTPLAYGPSHNFQVGLAAPAPSAEEQDRATEELLSQALIAVGRFYSDNGRYGSATATAFEALWAPVDFEEDSDEADVGLVAFDIVSDDQILLITQSPTGTYFCVSDLIGSPPIFAFGDLLSDLQTSCVEAVDDAAADEGDGGDGGDGGDESA